MTYQALVSAILQALYPLLLATVTAAVGALSKKVYSYLVTRFSAEELRLGRAIADHAVQFVEQVYVDLHGPDKLAAALQEAKALGARYGVNYTDEQWRTILEAALHSFNEYWKETPQAS